MILKAKANKQPSKFQLKKQNTSLNLTKKNQLKIDLASMKTRNIQNKPTDPPKDEGYPEEAAKKTTNDED